MRLEKKQMEFGRDFLLYGLSFLLLMEWLLPLPYITDTGFIHIFILFTAIFFFVTFIQLPLFVSMLIKTVVIVYGMFLVFFEGPFLSLEWMNVFLIDFVDNVGYIFTGQWHVLTDLFRSFLFFLLLAIMSYLLFYWTVYARRIFFFLILTVVYITVLDTFTVYDATYAIIRTFVIGFLLLGLVTIYRMIEQEKVASAPRLLPVRLALLLVAMVVTGGIFGFLSPKLEPQWADPVPFMRAAVGAEGDGFGDAVRRIGYGDNDEQLGGGFVDDDTPLFYAAATQEHYWRGETKDFYTGKGWETTTPEVESNQSFFQEGNSWMYELEYLEAEVAFADESNRSYAHLFYPGELITRSSIMEAELTVDAFTAKAETSFGDEPVGLTNYRYEYVYPTYHIEGLRSSHESDPAEITEFYTQLPEELPDRVRELAEEITAEESNRYDRAKAIERYLSGPFFQYETNDVAVPGEGEDYVDQFLFDTQRGYCDNFSTSMVVMLRTLDIPARWVKGFTQGEQIDTLDENRNVYQVTNGNAHSWVEVYFPEAGWVPFEPTSGFDSSFEFIEPELEAESTDSAGADQEEEDEEVEDVFAELEEEEEQNQAISPGSWARPGGATLLVLLGIALLFILFLKNKKVMQYMVLKRFMSRKDETAFIPAYERLLWLLHRFGWGRKDGETLREYANRTAEQFAADEMLLLTDEYERLVYGGKSLEASWSSHKGNWEALVRKIHS
ncbi:transglutaminase domain-containing protein [Alkalihalobacillus oceani]|uniref:Transglutaminase domain-containing protein n=1 Tax=Halalkalibacter oceani TaxID=1653776 RepID=A0A9X2IRD9_9BACI|nr:transglutaminase domain-containing protein [Halalkalibacter oceani]MCM3716347.1 transglutaminase domain-containing protein [Halalkalibacter oceani]